MEMDGRRCCAGMVRPIKYGSDDGLWTVVDYMGWAVVVVQCYGLVQMII
jgi:hypothetical protein